MARRGRKMNLALPGMDEACAMFHYGIRLTDLPALPGYIMAQHTRHSDKPNCRCNLEGKLHGPYYYRVWFETVGYTNDWKRRPILRRQKEYIRLADVPSVLARVRQYRIDNAIAQHGFRSMWPLIRSMFFGLHPLNAVRPRDLRRKWLPSGTRERAQRGHVQQS